MHHLFPLIPQWLNDILLVTIPTAVIGYISWRIQQKYLQHVESDRKDREKRQKEIDDRNEAQTELILMISRKLDATEILTEATAKAVQRIPDAHCNGDMKAALNRAQSLRSEQLADIKEAYIKEIEKENA